MDDYGCDSRHPSGIASNGSVDGGRFATSDLNDLPPGNQQNNRLKRLLELGRLILSFGMKNGCCRKR